MTEISNSIALVIGEPKSLKTSILMDYAYQFIESFANIGDMEEEFHGLIICQKDNIEQNNLYFGKYSDVKFEHLQKMKLKYVEKFEDIINFLLYFSKIPQKPKFICIDEPSSFLKNDPERLSKLCYLYSLMRKVCQSIESHGENYFKILITEPIKEEELRNDQRNKWNLKIFQYYFQNIFASRITHAFKKRLIIEKFVYNFEAQKSSQYLCFVPHSDRFLKKIVQNINAGF